MEIPNEGGLTREPVAFDGHIKLVGSHADIFEAPRKALRLIGRHAPRNRQGAHQRKAGGHYATTPTSCLRTERAEHPGLMLTRESANLRTAPVPAPT